MDEDVEAAYAPAQIGYRTFDFLEPGEIADERERILPELS
jgi:hypothetical protein